MKRRAIVVGAVMALVCYCQCARGQSEGYSQSGGVTVNGTGECKAKPDAVEINLRIAGTAELTNDAVIKQHDARDRATKAFEALKLEDMKIEERGLGVRTANSRELQQALMQGMAPPAGQRPQIDISSSLRVRVSKIADMPSDDIVKLVGKLLDTAQDSGGRLGPSDADLMMARYYGQGTTTQSLVKFIVTDIKQLREQAYQKAVDDARQRAERLAKLNDLKLGPVISVSETFVSTESGPQPRQQWEQADLTAGETSRDELAADTLAGTTLRVRVAVRFAIEPASKVAAK